MGSLFLQQGHFIFIRRATNRTLEKFQRMMKAFISLKNNMTYAIVNFKYEREREREWGNFSLSNI